MKKLTFKAIMAISRPRFWVYSLGPFLIGIVAAINNTELGHVLLLVILGLYFLTAANIYIYGINDIFDYDTDLLNPKKRDYEFFVTPELWRPLGIVIVATTLPFMFGLLLGSWQVAVAMGAFLFFAGQYSAPPLRAKSVPILDSFMSAGHYVSGGLVGYFAAGGVKFPILGVIAGLAWAMSMHAFSAVPDIEADQGAGIATVATFLGYKNIIYLCSILYVLSAILGAIVVTPWILIGILPYMILMYQALDSNKIFKVYTYFPLLNLAVGFIIFWLVFFF